MKLFIRRKALLIDTAKAVWPEITKTDFKKVTEIEVKTNPKSFTGSRVGATIANALGYLLKVPVSFTS